MGRDEETKLVRIINRYYETLWGAYKWPHLNQEDETTVEIQAGLNRYSVPAGFNQEGVTAIEYYDNGDWIPLDRGIGAAEYSAYDPNENQRNDPILRYKWMYADGGASELEVWPLPASDSFLKFIGRRVFTPLVAMTDICLLDDNLIILFAAAELLAADKSPRANKVESEATKLFAKLTGNLDRPKNNKFNMNNGGDSTPVKEVYIVRKADV